MKFVSPLFFIIPLLNIFHFSHCVEPIHPNTNEMTRSVFHYLNSIQGKKTLAGQHVIYGDMMDREIDHVVKTTGKYPALIEFEGGIFAEKYHEEYTKRQKQLVQDAKAYWDQGGLIAICWHWGNPMKPNNTLRQHQSDFQY